MNELFLFMAISATALFTLVLRDLFSAFLFYR